MVRMQILRERNIHGQAVRDRSINGRSILASVREPATDPVDDVIRQWQRERPDLELGPMAAFGRLGRFQAVASRSIESVFRAHGLGGIGDFDVLAALRRAGPPFTLTPTVLAQTLMLSPAGMTSRLDRLEAQGLLERRADPSDRRSTLAVLTDSGRALVDAAVTDHVANEARLLSPLTADEQRILDGLLRKLLAGNE
jgi:DNA-binding MarR family transcriptional regulator